MIRSSQPGRRAGPLARGGHLVTLGLVLVMAAGCSSHVGRPPQPPSPTVASSSAFPILSGSEFDKSLRNGQAKGESGLPQFGRLLAATQTGGPKRIPVDLTGVSGSVIGIFVCKGSGDGPAFAVHDRDHSLLWFKSSGCDDTSICSGQSKRVRSGDAAATLFVTTPKNIQYSFVLEEVP